MYKLKIGEEVEWLDSKGNVLSKGKIVGIKFTSPLGNIYKVNFDLKEDKIVGSTTKNIHENYLKKI